MLSTGSFDRVLGSVHSLAPDQPWLLDQHLYQRIGPDELMTTYLAEALRLASSSAPFAVLAHIDYPLRYWPENDRPFDAARYEDEVPDRARRAGQFRPRPGDQHQVPLPATIGARWYEAREAAAFGSDAHQPSAVARGFAEAAAMAKQPASTPAAIRTTSGFAEVLPPSPPDFSKRDFAACPIAPDSPSARGCQGSQAGWVSPRATEQAA